MGTKKHNNSDDESFINYVKMLDDETQQMKKKYKKTIKEVGDSLVNEMSKRGIIEENKRKEIIEEINKYKHGYDIDDLFDYDLRELHKILKTLKYQNRGYLKKLFDLLTNNYKDVNF